MFVKPLDESSILRLAEEISPAACGLRFCLRASRDTPWALSARGREQVTQLVEAGLTLRASWPRSWSTAIERQLGQRWYLSFAGNFNPAQHCTSIVCSALGRDGQKLPQWPMLLDLALQHMARRGSQLLLVPHTTTYAWAREFARRAELPSVELEVGRSSSAAEWLHECLERLSVEQAAQPLRQSLPRSLRQRVLISPGSAATNLPLQDQLSILLSDSIVALAVRSGGKIDQLLQMRLADSEFPLGTVFVALPAPTAESDVGPKARPQARRGECAAWLGRGAVGWYVLSPPPRPTGQWLPCRQMRPPPVQQLTAALESMLPTTSPARADEWLAHCTRGNAGPWPDESELSFQQRTWLAGVQAQPHPFLTLLRICREGNLTGTSRITRTEERCVSFSAVPLLELLKRRTFRSHLSRWDWEPYGLLVRREALEQLGARPVCYGSEADYDALPVEQRPYFQPSSRVKRGADSSVSQSWSEEREWRLLGDLMLERLPAGGLAVFVRTRREAEQLSRCAPCPVLWKE